MLLYFMVYRSVRFVITWRFLVVESLMQPFMHLQTSSFVLRSMSHRPFMAMNPPTLWRTLRHTVDCALTM